MGTSTLKGKPKHPIKVHVWAAISRRGVSKMAIFSGIMDAAFFVEGVLRPHLLPFITDVFPDSHRFMQDNDPKHTSRLAKAFYSSEGINWWPTPAESPDLNPIELVWHELKHFLRKTYKPVTKEGLKTFWETRMTKEKCNQYINHLKKVVPKVIERDGRASGY